MLEIFQLGRARYGPVLKMQRAFLRQRQRGEIPDRLILVEHEPVITLGRRGLPENILADTDALAAEGIEVHRIERGGDVTFHGPGQLVGYPIIDLRERGIPGPRRYVRMLEETLIRAVSEYGIEATRRPGLIGAWTDRGKIAAIGVWISRGVTMHGFALNVNTDADDFQLIVPCGLHNAPVTSLSQVLGRAIDLSQVAQRVSIAFRQVFGYDAGAS